MKEGHMTADPWSEDARGIWQSQESVVTRMSADDMRARADRWNRELDGTNWIAFACAGFLLIFFVWMLVIHQRTLQQLGAIVGIASAAYLTGVGMQNAGRRWVDNGATCVRAYKTQLERRRQADVGSARTILLMMTGCALLSSPEDWGPWTLQAASQLGTGILVYAYITRQARRFQKRIDELTRLQGD
jgi:peptidoglycan/LPS O-acetylase OafA/YrhL